MQRVAIVDPTESTRESLRTILLGVDFVWLEAECARYEYFFDVIHGSLPDLDRKSTRLNSSHRT